MKKYFVFAMAIVFALTACKNNTNETPAKKIDARRSEETQITVPVVTEETTDTSDSNVTMECLKELRHGNRVCCEAYRNNEKVGSISTRDETYFIEWVLEHEGCTFEIIR